MHPGFMNATRYYKELAEHYQLPYWNYRDFVVESKAFKEKWQNQPLPPIQLGRSHPMWFVHRFVADVFSACFDRTLRLCTDSSARLPSYDMNNQSLNETTKNDLPAPLYLPAHHSELCDDTQPFLVQVYANSTFRPENVTEYELKHMSSQGWQQYLDFGAVPGIIFNAHSDYRQNVLSFPFMQQGNNTNASIIPPGYAIKIMYLKSYENMGVAEVRVCGRGVLHENKRIDGLRQDFKVNLISTPSMFFQPLDKEGFVESCNQLPESNRTLDIEWKRSNDAYASIRRDQKVKILLVEICKLRTSNRW